MTNANDFPVSTDASQESGAGGDSFGPRPFGFVFKLSLPATACSTPRCGEAPFGGSHCLGKNAYNTVNAISMDRNGIATVDGATNAPDFPTTGGVVQSVCRCQEYANNGFLTQLNVGGSGLRWSTFLDGSWYGFSQGPCGTNTISALAQDAAGNVVVAAEPMLTISPPLPVFSNRNLLTQPPWICGPPTASSPSSTLPARLSSFRLTWAAARQTDSTTCQ